MALVKTPLTLILLVASLLRANNLGIINNNQLDRTLAELYFQPYPEFSREALAFRFPNFDHFIRPAGPLRVTIQVGHLLNADAPTAISSAGSAATSVTADEVLPLELSQLGRHGGAQVGTLREVEINRAVAEQVRRRLTERGYQVTVLSAVIPAEHYADAFIAIHADANNPDLSGFLISTPAVDYSGRGDQLREAIADHYWRATDLLRLPYASEAMTHYYAFNWSHFKHALHPATPAIIIEVGNLNNLNDLAALTLRQDQVAQGIVDGLETFFHQPTAAIIQR